MDHPPFTDRARDALRRQLTIERERDRAVRTALEYEDPRIIRLGLATLQQDCPPPYAPLVSAMAGVAGLLEFAKLSVGDPTVAIGLELDVIAAVIIGGGSLLGGKGSVVGTIAGTAIMAIIQIGCSQQGLPNWVQEIITGTIIVGAVALDRWRSKS